MEIKQFVFNPFMENTYVVYDHAGNAAVIDAGCLTEAERKQLSDFLDNKQLTLQAVLNTHLHLDHQFGNAYLYERYGIKPTASEADAFLPAQARMQAEFFGMPNAEDGQAVGQFLHDGEMLQVGSMTFEVLATPGHTPGGVCFYCAADKVLFSGDTLFQGGVGRTDLPYGDYGQLIEAIQKRLLPLPDDTVVYCGHGPYTTLGDEKRCNPFL